ncbi:hypothetical protein AWZ03_003933 [Drosophila navojoa]|uniref:cathepsin L n=1 Tax=Drosophila navojoa TaxID=7232 RepID=A0A484BP87_DRONA|nr:cathepsin L1-like [Drosophila navojoa]TDG49695.1 hypothetical protein AWZ03_003933 [Drosophila navojoa]
MKSVVIVLIALLVSCSQAIIYEDVLAAEFEAFKLEHEKSYEDIDEENLRMQIFKLNKETIDKHNERYARGLETYEMGINQFSDMLPEEFKQIMLSNINTTDFDSSIDSIYLPQDIEIPNEVDWRGKGAVTAVKNQGSCGSCWAFSATGALEGHHFIKSGRLIPLSEQNLMDCSGGYNNHGCHGGFPSAALMYVRNNRGIDTESSYPYEGRLGYCRYRRSFSGATVSGVKRVPRTESALAYALAEKGPVSVCVDASKFQHYRGGIFSDPSCGQHVNHAVLAVGYGPDFWLIKNSWGSWGEQGYMRLARNHGNMCKVASYAVFPTV